jgi:hypothetical protein
LRRRARRDLVTILGVVVVLVSIAGANVYMRIDTLKDQMIKVRKTAEDLRRKEGVALMDWELLRKTKGSIRSGARFHDTLKPYDGQPINVVGFMTPIDEFRDVTHFMLLPMPIYCYFCEAPPMRDILLIELEPGATANLVNEPVLIGGYLALQGNAGDPFFYSVTGAKWNAAVEGMQLTPKDIGQEHRLEMMQRGGELLSGEEAMPGDGELLAPAPLKEVE